MKAIKNLGSLIFGAVLLLIGLVASFYESRQYVYGETYISHGYPYQTVGIILILVGIVFVGLGLFYSPRKTNDLPPPPK
jgi:vacuolar-type H+-ATPase subunit I/STV1